MGAQLAVRRTTANGAASVSRCTPLTRNLPRALTDASPNSSPTPRLRPSAERQKREGRETSPHSPSLGRYRHRQRPTALTACERPADDGSLAQRTDRCHIGGMASEPENLVLEHLRAIRAGVDALRHDVREIKKTQAAVLQVLASHEARLQHIEDRLDRIERRLELTDA